MNMAATDSSVVPGLSALFVVCLIAAIVPILTHLLPDRPPQVVLLLLGGIVVGPYVLDVVDPSTVRLNLSAPFSPVLAALADRAGMMVSPKAAQAGGANFGTKPVCSGPFRFVERVAQDRISFERYPGYWNKANVHFEKVVYTPIVDATVRLDPAALGDDAYWVQAIGWQGGGLVVDQLERTPVVPDPFRRGELAARIPGGGEQVLQCSRALEPRSREIGVVRQFTGESAPHPAGNPRIGFDRRQVQPAFPAVAERGRGVQHGHCHALPHQPAVRRWEAAPAGQRRLHQVQALV